MSETLLPGLTPAKAMTDSASPVRSRASSVEKLSPTMGATSRPAGGNSVLASCCLQPSSAKAAKTASLVDIFNFNALAGDALGHSRSHEPVEVAVEHIRWSGRGDAGPEVLHQLVRLEDVGTDLVAPADVGLGGIGGAGLRLALLQLALVETRLQLLEGRSAVLVLRAFVL